jgi:hypothetical protein
MKADQFSKSILDLHPDIRFAGVIKSGHMYAYSIRSGIEERLRERNPEISFKLHILLI